MRNSQPSGAPVTIRLLEPRDLAVCAELLAAGSDGLEPASKDVSWNDDFRGLVAEVEGQVVGTVFTIIPNAQRYWFERYAPLDTPGFPADLTRANLCEIDDLVVRPDHRGRKIGVALAAAMPFVQRAVGARYVVGASGPKGRGIADRMGAIETGVQFQVGGRVMHIACAPVAVNCTEGGRQLDELVADGRIQLGPTLRKLVAGDAAEVPPVRPSATSIRMADAADVDDYIALQTEAFADRVGPDEAIVDRQLARHTRVLVAEYGGQLVGAIRTSVPGAPRLAAETYISLDDPMFPADLGRANSCESDRLVVGPAFRGFGVAMLLSAALAFLQRGLGARYAVGLTGEESRGIAATLGYQLVGPRLSIGQWDAQAMYASVDDYCAAAGPILAEQIAHGRLTLGPVVARLAAGEPVELPPIDWGHDGSGADGTSANS